jgi:hypothetical protein
MRGFDIGSCSRKNFVATGGFRIRRLSLLTGRHVAATLPPEQRRYGNPALVLTISQCGERALAGLALVLYLQAYFECARHHQVESIVTRRATIRTSTVNFVQGYSKVELSSDTGRKRYEFM